MLDPVTMQPVPWAGETMGEIMFRGNITMKGYLKNPSATEEAFAGGWFHTGDLAVMQPDSYAKIREGCHHFGRGRYFFYRGGGDAVVARPDEKWGQNAVRSSN